MARADPLVQEPRAAAALVVPSHADRVAGGLGRRAHQRVRVAPEGVAVAHLDDDVRPAREGGQRPAIRRLEAEALDHRRDVDDLGHRHGQLGRLDPARRRRGAGGRGGAGGVGQRRELDRGAHANTGSGGGAVPGLLGVDAHALEGADPARVVVAHEERAAAARAGDGLGRDPLGDALAVDALDPPFQGAAVLGADRSELHARLERGLDDLADEVLGAGHVDLGPHPGGGERGPDVGQRRGPGRELADARGPGGAMRRVPWAAPAEPPGTYVTWARSANPSGAAASRSRRAGPPSSFATSRWSPPGRAVSGA